MKGSYLNDPCRELRTGEPDDFPPDCEDGKCGKCQQCYADYVESKFGSSDLVDD